MPFSAKKREPAGVGPRHLQQPGFFMSAARNA
jgi:hypothetical protein